MKWAIFIGASAVGSLIGLLLYIYGLRFIRWLCGK